MGLTRSARNHWHHHSRFYFSAMAGIAVGALAWAQDAQLRLMLAGDVFYAVYLSAMALLANRITPAEMRKRSAIADEGGILIVLITLGVVGFSLMSLFALFDRPQGADWPVLVVSIASIPLGWFTLQLIMAYRYSHLYYIRADGKAKGATARDTGGLAFPGTAEPTAWDFIYYSFVVGMTAQVSDVDVTSTAMRKVTWAHGVVAFFYNAVLIALAVNIAVQSSG